MLDSIEKQLKEAGEKKYPIYRCDVNWKQDDLDYRNACGFTKMYRRNIGLEKFTNYAKNTWWNNHLKYKRNLDSIPLYKNNPTDIKFNIEFLGHETWCLKWFCHVTYNSHMTDEDLLLSFSEFVTRKTIINGNNGHFNNEHNRSSDEPYYCLMGAEDEWRWSEVCRCEGCQKNNRVMITH